MKMVNAYALMSIVWMNILIAWLKIFIVWAKLLIVLT